MAETALTVQSLKAPFDAIAANGADFTWAAADAVNGNSFPCSGREVLLVWNSDSTNPYTVTITSQPDERGRTKDITTYSLTAGEFACFTPGLTLSQGWINTNGSILVSGSNAAIKFAVLRIPAGYGG